MGFSVRHVVLGVAVTAAGFLFGIGYSLFVFHPADEVGGGDSLTQRMLIKTVGRVDSALDADIPALKRDVTELRRGMSILLARNQTPGAVGAASNVPADARELYRLQVTSDGKPQNFVRDASYQADPPNLSRLVELEGWTKDADLRKKWLFTGETQVVATFGAPDEIHPDAGGEWWLYWKRSGGQITHKYSLHMCAGRLLDVSFFENREEHEK